MSTLIHLPVAARFEVIITCTIFTERRERRVITTLHGETMGGVLVCLKKYAAKVRVADETEFWMSDIINTDDGRKRYEVAVLCDGKPVSQAQIDRINRRMIAVDEVQIVAFRNVA
jgi:hypothetical protein